MSAVIWDLNGVIVDDMRFHFLSFQSYLEQIGFEMTEDYFVAKCTGTPPNEVFAEILPSLGNPVSIEEAIERKRAIYFDLAMGHMQMLPGVRRLIEEIHAEGVGLAVASGATRVEVDAILTEFDVLGYFDAVVACEDVTRGKPDPEPFLTAAARIGALLGQCVVIEDGEYGVRAAKSCGMKAIAVTNTQTRECLSAADLIVASLEEVDMSVIRGLLL